MACFAPLHAARPHGVIAVRERALLAVRKHDMHAVP